MINCPYHPEELLRLVAYRKTLNEDKHQNYLRFKNIRYCKACDKFYEVNINVKPLRIVKMITR